MWQQRGTSIVVSLCVACAGPSLSPHANAHGTDVPTASKATSTKAAKACSGVSATATWSLARTPLDDAVPYATGISITDMNGDGIHDLVLAGGNDGRRNGHVALFLGTLDQGVVTFEASPTWKSALADNYMALELGDVTGNGCPDIAVSIASDPCFGPGPCEPMSSGGAALYTNARHPDTGSCGDLSGPPWIHRGFLSWQTALGDMDADGDLDLAVAASIGADVPFPPMPPRLPPAVASVVFANQGGALQATPSWSSPPPHQYDVFTGFWDADLDGRLDLFLGGNTARVFLGQDRGLAKEAAWHTSPPVEAVMALDVSAKGGTGTHRHLLAGTASFFGLPSAHSTMLYALPWCTKQGCAPADPLPNTGFPIANTPTIGEGARLLFANVDGQPGDEAIVNHWSQQVEDDLPGEGGYHTHRRHLGPTAFVQVAPMGPDEPSSLVRCDLVTPDPNSQHLLQIPFRACLDTTRVYTAKETLPAPSHGRTLTLSRAPDRVRTVARVRHGTTSPTGFRHVPGKDWVVLADPVRAGDQFVVEVDNCPAPSLVMPAWDLTDPANPAFSLTTVTPHPPTE